MLKRHVLDSLAAGLCQSAIAGIETAIDIGSGAGFPGVPLAVVWPQSRFTLVESIQKKAGFLSDMVGALGLANRVEVKSSRAEDLARADARGAYDLAVSRALSATVSALEYSIPFLKVGGRALLWKGPRYEQELEEAAAAMEILGADLESIKKYKLPGDDVERVILCFHKLKITSQDLPRGKGLVTKRPLGNSQPKGKAVVDRECR
jgi:16S rRNA (guanine527-N7)-methyltransferase